MGRPGKVIRMGTSMTYGEALALDKLLSGLASDRISSAELIRLARDPLVQRVRGRTRLMVERARALLAGAEPPARLPSSTRMAGREPALLPAGDDRAQ